MILSHRRGACGPAAAACIVTAALSACVGSAATGLAADAPPLRVMVKLVRASEDARSIGAQAARVAGVPVTYAAATSPVWHALSLHCAGAQCDAAIARLRAADSVYQAVEIDGRKQPAS